MEEMGAYSVFTVFHQERNIVMYKMRCTESKGGGDID